MEQEIKGVYDLTEHCLDVWKELNPDFDTPPTDEDLAYIRRAIQASYRWTARRLGEGRAARFDECGTFMLKVREGREVQNFHTGERFEMPDYLEVKFNASPTMEALVQEGLTPPKPEVH